MASEIVVLNRINAEEFDCPYDWACISIANAERDFAEIPDANRTALLRLAFADITRPMDDYLLFHDDQAHDILDFVTHHWEHNRTLMVHCDAGISRSSAVAAAIARLKWRDESQFLESPFEPNPLVYRTIREVATGRADYQHDEDDWLD